MSQPHRTIAFLCSSGLHVRLFSPTIKYLLDEGAWRPVVLSLDTFYAELHGTVASTVKSHKLELNVVPIAFRHGLSPNRWVRGLQTVWSARWRGTLEYRTILQKYEAGLLVLGNDTGLAELVAIDAARSIGVPTLLVQDGFLSNQYALATNRSRRRLHWEKLKIVFAGKLFGGRPYGMGGCDGIAAYGRAWADILKAQGVRKSSRVEVVGHPYLSFEPARPIVGTRNCVTYFCTNFLRSNLRDAATHFLQISEILQIRKLLDDCCTQSCVLRVKLHPADQWNDYFGLQGHAGIEVLQDVDASALIAASWFCITNISSVVLECEAEACPCLMSGQAVLQDTYAELFHALPGLKADNLTELRTWVMRMQSEQGMSDVLAAQRQSLESFVSIVPERSGMLRLTQLMMNMAMRPAIGPAT